MLGSQVGDFDRKKHDALPLITSSRTVILPGEILAITVAISPKGGSQRKLHHLPARISVSYR
jgi:hypothetical protein